MANAETLTNGMKECAGKKDFEGALKLVRDNLADFERALGGVGVRDALKETTDDRLLRSFLDGVEFGSMPLDKALVRLEKLVAFREKGALVLCDAWGLGKVRDADYFYRRITVDFKTKKGHQFTFAAAADMLAPAPADHVLVLRERDPAAFEKMLKDKKCDFVKAVLKSWGDMPVTRLEDVCVRNGFVKAANWKQFWDSARTGLKSDKCVEIPARRADPIRLKAEEENYGDGWLTAFSHETDPKLILASARAAVRDCKDGFEKADPAFREKVADRLAFAVTAARKVDDALYARLACLVRELRLETPATSEMQAYLWERRRYIKAAADLPAREVGAMLAFLADSDESKARLYAAIPDLCFAAVAEIAARFGSEPACRAAFGRFMKETQAPATLTTLIIGKIEQFGEFTYDSVNIDGKSIRVLKSYALWPELPPVATLLNHAIALGEGRRGGEALKMQNIVRRLFGDRAWLEKMFSLLNSADKALFFERFQASVAWDPASHHTTVVRMTKIAPELESRLAKTEAKKTYARVTSFRSFAMKKAEYLKLINEDMPANVRRIEFAKSYGDLSENAEYQYAKDEQRALMQKQSLMQADLEAVKPDDFSGATTDEVMPGVTVVADTKDGEKVWHVLGEWDNDVEMGVLSSKARVAQNMMGRRPGDTFELPDAEGGVSFATIREIRNLSDEVREWMKIPAGMEI